MKWRIGIALGAAAILAATPIIPVPETYLSAYQAPLYDTPQGHLDLGFCGTMGDGTLHAHVSDTGIFRNDFPQVANCGTTPAAHITGQSQWAQFQKSDGSTEEVVLTSPQYSAMIGLGGAKNNPSKTEGQSLLTFITPNASASITFNAKAAGTNGASPATQTYALDNLSGTNLIQYTTIYSEAAAGADAVSGVTYNTVAYTRVDTQPQGSGGNGRTYLYRIVGPATGSNNVVITYSSATFGTSASASYAGAKQSGGVFVSNKGFSSAPTNLTLAVVPNSANNWVVFGIGCDATCSAANSSVLRQAGSNVAATLYDTNADVSVSTTMGATISSSNVYGIAESFEPFVAAASFAPWQLFQY